MKKKLTRKEERVLVEKAKAGDTKALNTLLESCSAKLTSTVIRYLNGYEANGKDVSQEAMLRAMRKIHTFRGDCAFSSWLCRIGLNLAKNHIVADVSRPTIIGGSPWEWAEISINESLDDDRPYDCSPCFTTDNPLTEFFLDEKQPYDDLEREEAIEITQRIISQLSERERTVIHLRVFNGMTYSEIAEATGLTLREVKSSLERIYDHLNGVIPNAMEVLFLRNRTKQ